MRRDTRRPPFFKTNCAILSSIWSLAVYIARFRSQLRAHVFSMFSPCCRIFWRSLEISFDRTMKAVCVLKFLAGTRIEHSKTCPRAPPGRSRIWRKAARRQLKAALEPSFDASKRDPKREPEKIRFRTRKRVNHKHFLAPILGAKINKNRFRRGSRSGSSFGPRFLEVCSRKLRFSGPHFGAYEKPVRDGVPFRVWF